VLPEELAAELEQLFAAVAVPFPVGHPEDVLYQIEEPRQQLVHYGTFAYLRGDYPLLQDIYRRAAQYPATQLHLAAVMLPMAVGFGDWDQFRQIRDKLRPLAGYPNTASEFAELILAGTYIGSCNPSRISQTAAWIRNGESAISPYLGLPTALTRANYYLATGDYRSMLGTTTTALTLLKLIYQGMGTGRNCGVDQQIASLLSVEISLRYRHALALHHLDQKAQAEQALLAAMQSSLPLGFITPLAEVLPRFGGLADRIMRQHFPDSHDPVLTLAAKLVPNWLAFKNEHPRRPVRLEARDLEIAYRAAHGESAEAIASDLYLSPRTVNNRISVLSDKVPADGSTPRKRLEAYLK